MVKRLKVDWSRLVVNLRQHVPTKQIASELGVSVSCINNLAAGNVVNPEFLTGIHLLNLHYDYCADKHKQLYSE